MEYGGFGSKQVVLSNDITTPKAQNMGKYLENITEYDSRLQNGHQICNVSLSTV